MTLNNLITAPSEKSHEETDSTKEEAAKMEKEYGTLKDSTKEDSSNLGGKADEPKGMNVTTVVGSEIGKARAFTVQGKVAPKQAPTHLNLSMIHGVDLRFST